MYRLIFIAVIIFCALACRKDKDALTADDPLGSEYNGGGTTNSSNAYNVPVLNLSAGELLLRNAGEEIFQTVFQPTGTVNSSGLGPLYIQSSCVSCHRGNGRSQPPLDEADITTGLLMRLSISGPGIHGAPQAVPGFGTQLQTRASDAVTPEGNYFISYENITVTYQDGSVVNLRQPYYNFYNTYLPLPGGMLKSARLAPPVYGIGFLEAISDADILSRIDESDANSDGISGKANYVWNELTQQMELGRFGWKASVPNIFLQSAIAFNEDMGITTSGIFPIENCAGQSNCVSESNNSDIDAQVAWNVSYYLKTTGVPPPRNLSDPIVQNGQTLFHDLRCTSCHVPQLQTGISDIASLSNQVIHPYTDLLLHDMGEGLGDGRPDYSASANEWRTPPLWGIGLTKAVNPDATYLHDGRASTIEEAILWHGGEAYQSIYGFKFLSLEDRHALIAFVEAL